MAVYKLIVPPQQSGYSVSLGYNRIVQQTGYVDRYRRGVKRQQHSVTVSWLTDRAGYETLVAFYHLWMDSGTYFLADLIVDGADLQEYRCNMASGMQLTQIQGRAYYVSAQLTVQAKKRDQAIDEVVSIGVIDLINPLAELVNEDLPQAVGV